MGFDPKTTTRIWRAIKKLLKDDGYTIYTSRTKQVPQSYLFRVLGTEKDE
ncbi:DUF3173 family protein [Lactococcus hircilactis]